MSFSHQTARLGAGRHDTPDHGVCVMELASILAGEPFSDRPRAVSGAVTRMLQGYNDALDDERRQSLKPFAAASIGTAGGRAAERERRRLVRAWLSEGVGGRPLRRVRCLLGSIDLRHTGTAVARRVRARDDSALHARMLALLDSLIAVTGVGARRERFDAVCSEPPAKNPCATA
jgi:hypothetical protein